MNKNFILDPVKQWRNKHIQLSIDANEKGDMEGRHFHEGQSVAYGNVIDLIESSAFRRRKG